MTRREILPSERSDMEAAAEAEAKKLANLRIDLMREDFTRTFKTEHGKRVFAWLKKRCGFREIILSANRQSGGIDPMMTTFAAMELNLYIEMCKYLPTDLIQEIEDERRIQPSGQYSSSNTSSVGRTSRRSGRKSTT